MTEPTYIDLTPGFRWRFVVDPCCFLAYFAIRFAAFDDESNLAYASHAVSCFGLELHQM